MTGSGTTASRTVAAARKPRKIKGGSAMTPATSGAPDPPAADASPPPDRGASAPPPATARVARRMPNMIDRTAVPPAKIITVSEMAIDVTRELVLSIYFSLRDLQADARAEDRC